ncbi:TPA: Ail/Lom family outer membrane beta-barrel protein [Salmonella enterica subsp. salamae serovar 21:z10:[z6]]|nr:outer membrane beta-barrel protein [Salmonella enterica]ECC9704844.1 Ail/Lom family protein [Salmonella enterica subsp. salamae]HCM2006134.1 Ail/Lom family outer membrane beta-barrel protein [Salmonella enterica subsp. salamae serovar 21:z10:[z6]]
MRKKYATFLSVMVILAAAGTPATAAEHQTTLSAGYLQAESGIPGSNDLKGVNVKYRYEFTDSLGVITSLSYAGGKDRKMTYYSDTRKHEDSVRAHRFNFMAGPSLRVNDWFSAYTMIGASWGRVSSFSGDYTKVTDDQGEAHDVLTGSDASRRSNTSLAWSTGVQFNPADVVSVDLAYEGSGSGDWRTSAFIVGLGYRF